jgi:hypothetical protein
MRPELPFFCKIRECLLTLALFPLATASLPAEYVGDFSKFAEKGALPDYFHYEVEDLDTFPQGKQVLESEGLKIAFGKDRLGPFSGVVPSVVIDDAEKTWKISTTVSFDWYGPNSLSGAYPAGGVIFFSGKRDYVSFSVVHNGSQETDFVEIRVVVGDQNIRINGYNDPFVGDSPRKYTLTIEKDASGRITFAYNDGERDGALLVLDEEKAVTEKKAGFAHADGSAFSGEPDYTDLRNFLSRLAGKQVGVFVDGHMYGVKNPDKLRFEALFGNLTLSGLKVSNTDE